MARPLRIEFPGGVYHVTSRGDRREPIFVDDQDRSRLLCILAQAMNRFDAVVFAYCLMGNHYHFVLHTRQSNLSMLMRHVNGVYAQAFNRRHGLVGHLFQGRFTSLHVDRDVYLMQVCRYAELNPVRAGIVDSAVDWPWSSYRAHCGLVASPPWLDTVALHDYLLGRDASSVADRLRAMKLYIELVEDGRGSRLWEQALQRDIYLGGDAFVESVQERASSRQSSSIEIPKVQRPIPTATASSFETGSTRDQSLFRAYVDGRMSMSAIAEEVGLSVSRVSRLIARMERRSER